MEKIVATKRKREGERAVAVDGRQNCWRESRLQTVEARKKERAGPPRRALATARPAAAKIQWARIHLQQLGGRTPTLFGSLGGLLGGAGRPGATEVTARPSNSNWSLAQLEALSRISLEARRVTDESFIAHGRQSTSSHAPQAPRERGELRFRAFNQAWRKQLRA